MLSLLRKLNMSPALIISLLRRDQMARRIVSNSSKTVDFSDIEERIKPVHELPLIVSMVTFGRSGTGKTTFSSTWPKPLLLLDVKDEGTDSIKDVEGIDVLSIEAWDDIEKAYWYIMANKDKYKSVVIDTVTQLQDKCLDKVLKDEGKDFASQQIWGKVSGLMKTVLMNYRDLQDEGIHINFIAQDRVNDTETDGEDELDPEVGPRLMPSVAGQLNAAVKVIGNTYIKEVIKRKEGKLDRQVEYRMRIGPHAYYITKVRKPKDKIAPEYITDPSFDQIISIMKGEYEEKSSSTITKKKSATRRKKGGVN